MDSEKKKLDDKDKDKLVKDFFKKFKGSREFESQIPFHPQDWLTDIKLNICSYATKGVWIDMLCYMHNSDPYGFLTLKDKILDEKAIRKLFDKKNGEFDLAWEELNKYDIIGRNEINGAYFSKRLVIDYNIRKEARQDKIFASIKLKDKAKEIVLYLNNKTEKKYDATLKKTIFNIGFWINKKYTVEDFKRVIDIKFVEWGSDEKMSAWLRPETLFGDKFESYLNQFIKKVKTKTEKTFDKIDENSYIPIDMVKQKKQNDGQ